MANKSKKAKNNRLPKRIAGVKVPKRLRKSSGSMLALAQTPVVREIIASGLVAAAAAMAGSEGAKKKRRKSGQGLGSLIEAGEHRAHDTAQAAGQAVAAAMDRWLGGSLHWQSAEGGGDADEQGKAGKKPPKIPAQVAH